MSSNEPSETNCARCQRPNPSTDGPPDDWEVLVDDEGAAIGVICEDCITPDEQQVIDDADMALGDEVNALSGCCARCMTDLPRQNDPGDPLPDGWKILDHELAALLIVCPDCARADE